MPIPQAAHYMNCPLHELPITGVLLYIEFLGWHDELVWESVKDAPIQEPVCPDCPPCSRCHDLATLRPHAPGRGATQNRTTLTPHTPALVRFSGPLSKNTHTIAAREAREWRQQ